MARSDILLRAPGALIGRIAARGALKQLPAAVCVSLARRALSASSPARAAAPVAHLGPFGLKNDYKNMARSNMEKPWRTELNPAWLLERAARIYPTNSAVIHEGREYNYKEMNERVLKFAAALKSMGLKKGDKVIFICPNTPSILEGHFAVPLAGGVIVTVNTRLKPEEIGYIVQHAEARFAIIDKDSAGLKDSMLKEWGVEKVIVDSDTGKPGCEYQDMLDKAEKRTWWSFEPLESEEELMSICYTSGTTGNPKGE